MENSTATHAPGASAVEAKEDGVASSRGTTSRARRRGTVLARMLFTADSAAACIAAAIAVAPPRPDCRARAVAYVAGATILWPLAAFSIGLYRSDQLATWASAVTEIPRAFVAILLITWPLFGLAVALDLDQVSP